MTDFLKTTIASRVARLTLARPDLHNAFNEVVIDEITAGPANSAAVFRH